MERIQVTELTRQEYRMAELNLRSTSSGGLLAKAGIEALGKYRITTIAPTAISYTLPIVGEKYVKFGLFTGAL